MTKESYEERVARQLEGIRRDCMVEGWTSYNSDAITEEALRAAEIITESVWVFPRSDGGINLCWLDEALIIGVDKDGKFNEAWFSFQDATKDLESRKTPNELVTTPGFVASDQCVCGCHKGEAFHVAACACERPE